MNFEQAHRLDNLHVSGTRVVFSKCAELAAQNIPVTALTLGEPDFSTPPVGLLGETMTSIFVFSVIRLRTSSTCT